MPRPIRSRLITFDAHSQRTTAAVIREQVEPKWLGSKEDPRLYWKVRAEKQKLLRDKYERLKTFLDEPTRRLWAGNEATAFGRGGIRAVAEALRMSQETVLRGIRELNGEMEPVEAGRERLPGGGRKSIVEKDPAVVKEIGDIVAPQTSGEQFPLKWTLHSLSTISVELRDRGWKVSPNTIGKILQEELGYRSHTWRSIDGGPNGTDPARQFEELNRACREFQKRNQPVISLDARRTLTGDRKATSVPNGFDRGTAEFAASAIRLWWTKKGREAYPKAEELLIVSDAELIPGDRTKPNRRLHNLAAEMGLVITIRPFPSGTCKWSRIDYRLSSQMMMDILQEGVIKLDVTVDLVGRG